MLWPFVWRLVPIKSISTEAGIPCPTIPALSWVPLGADSGRARGAGRGADPLPPPWGDAREEPAGISLHRGDSRVEKDSFCRVELSRWKKSLWVSPGSNQEMASATWHHRAARNQVDSDVRLCYTQQKDALCKGCCKIKHSSKVLLWQNIADRNLRICIFPH